MAFFGFFKSKQDRDVESAAHNITGIIFPRGRQDFVRDCSRVDALTNQKIPQAELGRFVIGCKSLMHISKDHVEARFLDSFVRRAANRITKSEAYDMYVYFDGEADYYDKMNQRIKAMGKDVPALSDELAKKMPWIYSQGTREDVIQGGYGEFGLTKTNPIPTISVRGSNHYLARLRLGGHPIEAHRRGSTGSDVTPGPVDIYALACNGWIAGTVFICPYHKRNSQKAPEGFTLD